MHDPPPGATRASAAPTKKPRNRMAFQCAREDSNLHGPFSPQGPSLLQCLRQPRAAPCRLPMRRGLPTLDELQRSLCSTSAPTRSPLPPVEPRHPRGCWRAPPASLASLTTYASQQTGLYGLNDRRRTSPPRSASASSAEAPSLMSLKRRSCLASRRAASSLSESGRRSRLLRRFQSSRRRPAVDVTMKAQSTCLGPRTRKQAAAGLASTDAGVDERRATASVVDLLDLAKRSSDHQTRLQPGLTEHPCSSRRHCRRGRAPPRRAPGRVPNRRWSTSTRAQEASGFLA